MEKRTETKIDKKISFVIVGMAGSGKTSFCQRLFSWVFSKETQKEIEAINLDPAVQNTKMPCTIDIRDTIDFRETMEKYALGPNGSINTCLNLFLMKNISFNNKKITIIDTPGQIESFIWNSSGEIILRKLENPVILYIVDISSNNLYEIVSNFVFAAAIKERFKIEVVLIFNKCDQTGISEVEKYLDYEYLRNITNNEKFTDVGILSTYFEEFYRNLKFVKTSALTGEGKKEFFDTIFN
ncbi:ATP-GTP-binding protein [Nucleospora cyclopteri]